IRFGPRGLQLLTLLWFAVARERADRDLLRYRFGRAASERSASSNPSAIFDVMRRKVVVAATENPRVGGSIPPLATTYRQCYRPRYPPPFVFADGFFVRYSTGREEDTPLESPS